MQIQDLERIAKLALRDLGAPDVPFTVTAEPQPDRWRLSLGGHYPSTIIVRAGAGTTPQYVRQQIFEQYSANR